MKVLAVAAIVSGIGLIMQMIAWCINTWQEASREEYYEKYCKTREDSNMISFEEFSRRMRNKETMRLGE